MVPFWDLSDYINDLTSKKISLAAPQNLIAKLFGQQPEKAVTRYYGSKKQIP
jgi:hypothetical protein